jgi:DNA polymerase I
MATHIIIDSHNLICRCYYGIPLFFSPSGMPSNAIEGWVNGLSHFQARFPGSKVWCVFDGFRSERKHALLPSYKSSRESKDETLAVQIPFIRRITPYFGINTLYHETEEADDVIAALIKQLKLENPGDIILVASNDKDLCQCVDAQVFLLKPPANSRLSKTWTVEGKAYVLEKYGVTPNKIVDYLCLVGDKSDTIPGIMGVGPKIAAKLLNSYSSLEGIYANLPEINTLYPQLVTEFATKRDLLFTLNRQLIRLDDSITVDAKQVTERNSFLLRAFLQAAGLEYLAFQVEQTH